MGPPRDGLHGSVQERGCSGSGKRNADGWASGAQIFAAGGVEHGFGQQGSARIATKMGTNEMNKNPRRLRRRTKEEKNGRVRKFRKERRRT